MSEVPNRGRPNFGCSVLVTGTHRVHLACRPCERLCWIICCVCSIALLNAYMYCMFVNESTCPGSPRHKPFGISRGSPQSQFMCSLYSVNVCTTFCIVTEIKFYSILFYSILFYSILFYSILFYSILFYSILLYSTLLYYSILFYSILFYSILFYSILFYSILFYSILFYSILFYSILFYSILFYSILFYSILFYSILFYSILFYSILFYSILFYSILFYSILFYSILFYSILFYSILFYSIHVENNYKLVFTLSFVNLGCMPDAFVSKYRLRNICVPVTRTLY